MKHYRTEVVQIPDGRWIVAGTPYSLLDTRGRYYRTAYGAAMAALWFMRKKPGSILESQRSKCLIFNEDGDSVSVPLKDLYKYIKKCGKNKIEATSLEKMGKEDIDFISSILDKFEDVYFLLT